MLRFAITAGEIDVAAQTLALADPRAGAFVTFDGLVRNHNEGQEVDHLEYEVFEALAVSEGTRILAEAAARFGLHGAVCIHRSGALAIGERAVWVGVTASHRDAAFRACRYVIDEIKQRLPIWKREVYRDGRIEWVNCQACATHTHVPASDETAFYSRQTALPEIGNAGQAKLREATVLVVGLGGLGGAAAQGLAGAGVGQLRLCDFDRLEAGNLHRQFLYTHDEIGKAKADSAVARLAQANPFIAITAHAERFVADSADRLLAGCSVAVDCTDNLAAKFALNDACCRLGIPLVTASVHRFDGQLMVIEPLPHGRGRETYGEAVSRTGEGVPQPTPSPQPSPMRERELEGGCLRCLWDGLGDLSDVDTCSEAGVIGALPALLGMMQSLEAIKLILGLESPATDRLVLFDGLTLQSSALQRARKADCPACGTGVPAASPSWELSVDQLATSDLAGFELLDLRSDEERRDVAGPAATSRADWNTAQLEPGKRYLAFCARGARSRRFAAGWQARGCDVHAALCTPQELAALVRSR